MQLLAEELTIERGARRVIGGLSLSVSGGEALVLTGPNGAGKTTLLRTLAGFIAPSAGRIRLEDGDGERTIGEQAHFIGHANASKPSLTVAENLLFWRDYLAKAMGEIPVLDALDHFGLAALSEFPSAYLSAGQKRRLALARLLVADRAIWLLDQPTASLDLASSDRLVAAVNGHTARGGLAVIATHLPLALERAKALQLQPARIAA